MRVLHVNTELGWRGGERQTLLTLQGLTSRGVETALAAQLGGRLAEVAESLGIEVFPLKMRGGADPLAAFKLARVARRFGANALHLQTAHAASLALLARVFGLKARLVASRRVDFPITRAWKYNRMDIIAAISGKIRDVLVEGGVEAKRIRIVPSGVPTDVRIPPNLEALRRELAEYAPIVIGTVGHLADHKGHRVLLDALPGIITREPSLRLVIVGDGELRGALERQASDLGIADHVLFAGFREDALDLIWAFDLFVLPSLLEGLCTTLFDVMLRGVPIVGSDTGGIPEALDNGRYGALVPPGDPRALADRVLAILRDDAAKKAMTDGAAEWVRERYSVDAMVDSTVGLYREVLG
ncbi:MAG TPA: glycosyltransferase [Acidobacteriota bacterium]|nr:glycosyltransferase [Acidobacteriota bacterium]